MEATSIEKLSETMDFSLDFSAVDNNAGKVDASPAKSASKEIMEATSLEKISETMDFSLDFPTVDKNAGNVDVSPAKAVSKEIMDIGLDEINLNLDKPVAPMLSTEEKDAQWHDVASKLDLAKAYQEMGDVAGAREILEEVLREGGEQHRMEAETLLQQLPS